MLTSWWIYHYSIQHLPLQPLERVRVVDEHVTLLKYAFFPNRYCMHFIREFIDNRGLWGMHTLVSRVTVHVF